MDRSEILKKNNLFIFTIVIVIAQLSQRDCETLRVVEYFANSPKVTQGHSK